MLGILVFWQGCAPKYVRLAENRPAYTREEGKYVWAELQSNRSVDIAKLKEVADEFLGIPYLYGGEGPDSIDCSAFTQQVARKALGLELPRRAVWQSELGVQVFRYALQPGDFLFFGPNYQDIDHVGIYMGDGLFINATTSQGVKYSNIDERFWREKYQFAKRLIF